MGPGAFSDILVSGSGPNSIFKLAGVRFKHPKLPLISVLESFTFISENFLYVTWISCNDHFSSQPESWTLYWTGGP